MGPEATPQDPVQVGILGGIQGDQGMAQALHQLPALGALAVEHLLRAGAQSAQQETREHQMEQQPLAAALPAALEPGAAFLWVQPLQQRLPAVGIRQAGHDPAAEAGQVALKPSGLQHPRCDHLRLLVPELEGGGIEPLAAAPVELQPVQAHGCRRSLWPRDGQTPGRWLLRLVPGPQKHQQLARIQAAVGRGLEGEQGDLGGMAVDGDHLAGPFGEQGQAVLAAGGDRQHAAALQGCQGLHQPIGILPALAVEQVGHPWPHHQVPGSGPAQRRTSPLPPSISSQSSFCSRELRPASSVTIGSPSSRATIATWESTLPRSTSRAQAWGKSSTQPGSVQAATRMRGSVVEAPGPSSQARGLLTSATLPRTRPGEQAVPCHSAAAADVVSCAATCSAADSDAGSLGSLLGEAVSGGGGRSSAGRPRVSKRRGRGG